MEKNVSWAKPFRGPIWKRVDFGRHGQRQNFWLKKHFKRAAVVERNGGKKLYTINVKDSEYVDEFKSNHFRIQLDKRDLIRPGSVVVVEDIINLTTKDEISLRLLPNYDVHHKKLKVFCVSHNIFKTKLYNTISYFNFILFTSSLGNLYVMRKCIAYYQIEAEQVETWMEKFKMFQGKQGIYFFFDASQRQFYATNNLLSANASRPILAQTKERDVEKIRAALQARFELFFRGRKNYSQAVAVFSIIIQCLNPDQFKLVDLTVKFRSKRASGDVRSVSVIDYIDCLLNVEARPTQAQQVLHNFVRSHCVIPKIFMLNPYLI